MRTIRRTKGRVVCGPPDSWARARGVPKQQHLPLSVGGASGKKHVRLGFVPNRKSSSFFLLHLLIQVAMSPRDTRPRLNRVAVKCMDGIEDCWPQTAILPILHAHAGQSILIRVYRNGCVKRKGFHVEAYDVPSARPDINRKFRGHNESGWWLHWITGSASQGGTPLLQDGDELCATRG